MQNEHESDRTLSTADLAEPGRDAAEAESRELTDGRYDETQAEAEERRPTAADEESTPLFDREDGDRFRGEWDSIQTGFVDEPRRAVERADALVAELMQRLASSFAEERSRLEGHWDRGDDVSTEDLRVALQRYRSFFTRLLNA